MDQLWKAGRGVHHWGVAPAGEYKGSERSLTWLAGIGGEGSARVCVTLADVWVAKTRSFFSPLLRWSNIFQYSSQYKSLSRYSALISQPCQMPLVLRPAVLKGRRSKLCEKLERTETLQMMKTEEQIPSLASLHSRQIDGAHMLLWKLRTYLHLKQILQIPHEQMLKCNNIYCFIFVSWIYYYWK